MENSLINNVKNILPNKRWILYLVLALLFTIYFTYKNSMKEREVGIDYFLALYFVLFLLLLVFDEIVEFFYIKIKSISDKIKEQKQ